MADAKGVVPAFRTAQERREPILLLDRRDCIATAGKDLVRITLVADVPHDAVARRVVEIVQRGSQLDDAESRAEMAADAGDRFDQVRAQFIRDARKFGFRNTLQVCRRIDLRKQRITRGIDHPRIVAQRGHPRTQCRQGACLRYSVRAEAQRAKPTKSKRCSSFDSAPSALRSEPAPDSIPGVNGLPAFYDALASFAARVRPPKRRRVWRIRIWRLMSRISWMRLAFAASTSLRVSTPTMWVGFSRSTTTRRPTFSPTIRSEASRREWSSNTTIGPRFSMSPMRVRPGLSGSSRSRRVITPRMRPASSRTG